MYEKKPAKEDKMPEIKYNKLLSAFFCIALFSVSILAGFFSRIFFLFAAVSISGYAYIDKKYLRCPHCGGFENVERLFYAASHQYHCRHCGKILNIRK